jgi:hypothetical protein
MENAARLLDRRLQVFQARSESEFDQTAMWPLAARAHQQTMPVIGFLDPRSPDAVADLQRAARRPALAAVHDHKRLGYQGIEGVPPRGPPGIAGIVIAKEDDLLDFRWRLPRSQHPGIHRCPAGHTE